MLMSHQKPRNFLKQDINIHIFLPCSGHDTTKDSWALLTTKKINVFEWASDVNTHFDKSIYRFIEDANPFLTWEKINEMETENPREKKLKFSWGGFALVFS